MIPTQSQMMAIAGRGGDAARRNGAQIIEALRADAGRNGLTKPHRLAHFIPQVGHESGRWRYDEEVWGPTTAQTRYEGRVDLGNIHPGDGFKFRGRTGIMITGRDNYRQFTAWVRQWFPKAPDFEQVPDAILLDPWEGLVPIWYWSTRNLNRYADTNDIGNITRIINGGYNGYQDRLDLYVRAALVLLDREPTAVREFQASCGLVVDGMAGDRTRNALHAALVALSDRSCPALRSSWLPSIRTIAKVWKR